MKPRLSYFPEEGGRGQGRLEESMRAEVFPCPGPERPSFVGEQRVLGQFTLGSLKVAGASWASGLGAHTSVGQILALRLLAPAGLPAGLQCPGAGATGSDVGTPIVLHS